MEDQTDLRLSSKLFSNLSMDESDSGISSSRLTSSSFSFSSSNFPIALKNLRIDSQNSLDHFYTTPTVINK